MGLAMQTLPETRYLLAAVVLAEELSFTRAASEGVKSKLTIGHSPFVEEV